MDNTPKNGAKVRAMRPEHNPTGFMDEVKAQYGDRIRGVQIVLTLTDGQCIICASGGITHKEAVYAARMLAWDTERDAFSRTRPEPR